MASIDEFFNFPGNLQRYSCWLNLICNMWLWMFILLQINNLLTYLLTCHRGTLEGWALWSDCLCLTHCGKKSFWPAYQAHAFSYWWEAIRWYSLHIVILLSNLALYHLQTMYHQLTQPCIIYFPGLVSFTNMALYYLLCHECIPFTGHHDVFLYPLPWWL